MEDRFCNECTQDHEGYQIGKGYVKIFSKKRSGTPFPAYPPNQALPAGRWLCYTKSKTLSALVTRHLLQRYIQPVRGLKS